MTGLPADNPLNVEFHNREGDVCNLKLPTPSETENHIAKLQESLALMHKLIVQTSSNERQAHRNSDKKFRQKPNFTMGDYVLIGIAEQHSNRKLYLKWRGPYIQSY